MVFDAVGAREMALELARERGLTVRPVWIQRRTETPLLGRRSVRPEAVVRGPLPFLRGDPALLGTAHDLAEIAREREENYLFGGVGMLSVTIFYEDDERPLFERPDGPVEEASSMASPGGRAAARTVVEKADRRGLLYALAYSLAFVFGSVALLLLYLRLWPTEGSTQGAPALGLLLAWISLLLAHLGLAALAAWWLRRRYYRSLVLKPPRPSEAAVRRAVAVEEKEARWRTMNPDERSLEYMRNSGRAAALLALIALPFAAGAFGLSVPARTGAWIGAGVALLGLCASYALLGTSERARSFAYPERPGAAAVTMLTAGLVCLLVVFATWAASGGPIDLLLETLRRATGD